MRERVVVHNRAVVWICILGGLPFLAVLIISVAMRLPGMWKANVGLIVLLGGAVTGLGLSSRRLVLENDVIKVVEFFGAKRRRYRLHDVERVELLFGRARLRAKAKDVPARFIVRFRDGYVLGGFVSERGFDDFLSILRSENVPISEPQTQS